MDIKIIFSNWGCKWREG